MIVISGEFSGVSVPESVLAHAFFSKGAYKIPELFDRICDLVHELPTRPKVGKSNQVAVWVLNNKGTVAVICSECLRTFPVEGVSKGINEAECDFCSCQVRFEMIGETFAETDASPTGVLP